MPRILQIINNAIARLSFIILLLCAGSIMSTHAQAADKRQNNKLIASIQQGNNCPSVAPAHPFIAPSPSYLPKYHTSIHRFLEDEKAVSQVNPTMYSILDSLIDEAVTSLPKYNADLSPEQARQFAENALKGIDCILLRHGFVYPGHGAVQLLSDGLGATIYNDIKELEELKNLSYNTRRQAFIKARGNGPFYVVDCDIASYLYIAIAQVMAYPIHLVDIPNHNFVRWDLGGGHYINYETIDGFVTDDNYYRTNWQIPADFVGRGGTLLSMNDNEIWAYHDASVAIAWSWQHNYENMLAHYLRSISLDPHRALAYNNLAWYYAIAPKAEQRDGEKAVKYATQASNLFPSADDFDTLACAYAQAGDFKQAIITEKKAATIRYTPFAAEIQAHIELFKQQRTCEDPTFDVDAQPFKPH